MNRWSQEQINAWWAQQPWLVGANYVPSDAVNNVEMWRKDTFHPELIRRELGYAAACGMNTVRVFLSYIVWEHEGEEFLRTFETFLQIADECGVLVMPILFDDCAFDGGADPVYGPQPDPIPGIHNGRWVPSPGMGVQDDPAQQASCREYVHAIVGAHREDRRIVIWDLYNEPGNTDRMHRSLPLLIHAFQWAREMNPTQPLTAGMWRYTEDWSGINQVIADISDLINLHHYESPEETRRLAGQYLASGRPVIISEWLHRPNGCTIQANLPFFKEKKIGAWQWGLIQGRTQTHLNWIAAVNADPDDPHIWQHDLLYPDGTPYCEEEIALLRTLTGRP